MKDRWDLLPLDALQLIARTYTFGAKKHGHEDWLGTTEQSWRKQYASLMRHLTDWMNGKEVDDESGLPNLAHVTWRALCLLTMVLRKRGYDDRFVLNPRVHVVKDVTQFCEGFLADIEREDQRDHPPDIEYQCAFCGNLNGEVCGMCKVEGSHK